MRLLIPIAALTLASIPPEVFGEDSKPGEAKAPEDGIVTLFNGKDLSGWQADDGARKHWQSNDAVLRCDGKGEQKEHTLWTAKEYSDYELTVDWRLTDKSKRRGMWQLLLRGDKGIRIDVESTGWVFYFSPPGADDNWDCADLEGKKPLGEWSRLHVRVKGRELAVRGGKPDYETADIPAAAAAKGPVGLRAVDAPVEFTNIMVRELK
jgi:hypothetical protein